MPEFITKFGHTFIRVTTDNNGLIEKVNNPGFEECGCLIGQSIKNYCHVDTEPMLQYLHKKK